MCGVGKVSHQEQHQGCDGKSSSDNLSNVAKAVLFDWLVDVVNVTKHPVGYLEGCGPDILDLFALPGAAAFAVANIIGCLDFELDESATVVGDGAIRVNITVRPAKDISGLVPGQLGVFVCRGHCDERQARHRA